MHSYRETTRNKNRDKNPEKSCRVKICGITRIEDALCAQRLGADAIGLVFYPPSPRHVSMERAGEILAALGPFITTVGLFVNADVETVNKVLREVPLQLLQFHGQESRQYCEQFYRPYIKALQMKAELDVPSELDNYPSAQGMLLDTYRKGTPGGTGEVFDWHRVPRSSSKSIVLAGGLRPDNVAQAIAETGVYGVDVSGGVESAPGIKDADKMQGFIQQAKHL